MYNTIRLRSTDFTRVVLNTDVCRNLHMCMYDSPHAPGLIFSFPICLLPPQTRTSTMYLLERDIYHTYDSCCLFYRYPNFQAS